MNRVLKIINFFETLNISFKGSPIFGTCVNTFEHKVISTEFFNGIFCTQPNLKEQFLKFFQILTPFLYVFCRDLNQYILF